MKKRQVSLINWQDFSLKIFPMNSFRKSYLLRYIFPMLVLGFLFSCSLILPKSPQPPRNNTKTILFKCDSYINHGMLLPVDVIYVTADDNLKEVTKIGPNVWFDSKERESWPHKQTLSLRSGIEVRLKLNKPPDTKYVVIFAPFFKGEDQEAQQIILPPDPEENKKEKEEVVWVGANSLYH
jgi:hypothetical protein